MIDWLEKHNKISLCVTILIATLIFYVSSLTFEGGTGGGSNINAILYHLFAFFFLAFFLNISIIKGKYKKFILLTFIIAVLYAISDEIHQIFVPTRNSSLSDILIDSAGIAFASLTYLIRLEYKK